MVRIGIGMLGESPNSEIQKQLQSVVSFKTVISQISQVENGESVGYSRKYKTDHLTKLPLFLLAMQMEFQGSSATRSEMLA